MAIWWQETEGEEIRQGDFLRNCPVPAVPEDFNPVEGGETGIEVHVRDVVVLTQSCDLVNFKARFVALCPVFSLGELQAVEEKFKDEKFLEEVRRGNTPSFHMLSGIAAPQDNSKCLIVDFREIYSLPLRFAKSFAGRSGKRHRLHSPYLEHLAQSFARFFMRVGLPSGIPAFNSKKKK